MMVRRILKKNYGGGPTGKPLPIIDIAYVDCLTLAASTLQLGWIKYHYNDDLQKIVETHHDQLHSLH